MCYIFRKPWVQGSLWQCCGVSDMQIHKDKDKDKDKHKIKYKDKEKCKDRDKDEDWLLKRPDMCYIFEIQGVKGYQGPDEIIIAEFIDSSSISWTFRES